MTRYGMWKRSWGWVTGRGGGPSSMSRQPPSVSQRELPDGAVLGS